MAERTFTLRDLDSLRATAQEALLDYAEALTYWNAPDDAHTSMQIREMAHEAISASLGAGSGGEQQ